MYIGRFAPSPTGPLHAGSMVAALASWLDARAHHGRWLVRMEDVDTPRCVPGAAETILSQLAACGLLPDHRVLWQSTRGPRYAEILEQLRDAAWVYPCVCSRGDIAAALARVGSARERHREQVYPGTCRPARRDRMTTGPEVDRGASMEPGAAGNDRPRRIPAWRLRTQDRDDHDIRVDWFDRRLGRQHQDVAREVGDFVLKRADGLWAYQLAVVVDDADQGVTDVVRGEDLADNTARQIHLQRVLGVATPRYLHTALILAADGQKLSKQTGAQPVDVRSEARAVATLRDAARVLGLPPALVSGDDEAGTPAQWLPKAEAAWRLLAPPLA
jgi:glutamyl-Q tRNA(Asp) synthetase